METKTLAHIDRPEIANYIRSVGRELAHAVKKSKKANLDSALKDVLYCLNEPVGEKHKTMLDYVHNEQNVYNNNEKSRIRSVANFKGSMEENKDEISNLFNPNKKGKMNQTFYDRKKDEMIRKEKKLQIIKNKKRIEEEKNYKVKPQMNKQSQRIIDTKLPDKKPIYARSNEILNNKSQKLDKLKAVYSELKVLEEEESIGSFKPPGTYNEERFVEWRKEREERDRRKNEKIDRIKQEFDYLETESMKHMYKPSIDKKSEKIVKSKQSGEDLNEPIYDKLYNLHSEKFNKLSQLSMKTMPTFAPSINNKLPNFLQNSISNKITKNSSMSMGNHSMLKKLSAYSKHFLNSSVELKSSPLLKNDKVLSNEYLAMQHSRNKINSSMTEFYNNPLYISKYEDEEPDIVSRYRLALQLSSDKVNKLNKNPKFRANSSFNDSREWKSHIPWQTSIHFVNKNVYGKDDHPNSLYKINVRNSSAWDKNKENNIYYDQKVSNVLRSVNYNRVSSSKK